MDHQNNQRRLFLKTLGGMSLAVVAGLLTRNAKAIAEVCDKVKPANVMANALGYIPKSKTKGQNCANCIQYKTKNAGDKIGACAIFQGCEVAGEGWCKSWAKKA